MQEKQKASIKRALKGLIDITKMSFAPANEQEWPTSTRLEELRMQSRAHLCREILKSWNEVLGGDWEINITVTRVAACESEKSTTESK